MTLKQEALIKSTTANSEGLVAQQNDTHGKNLRLPADQYCKAQLDQLAWADKLTPATRGGLSLEELKTIQSLINYIRSEGDWWDSGRPYFNVWPILFGLIESLPLDVPWQRVRLPYKALIVCFPVGQEPYGMGCSLIVQANRGLYIRFQSIFDPSAGGIGTFFPDEDDITVEETLNKKPPAQHKGNPQLHDAEIFSVERQMFLLRMAVFIGVLSQKDREKLLTPVLLKRDEERFTQTQDDALKEAMLARAARQNGAGFDLGKKQQAASEQRPLSPHKRRAHWQRYWVGPGRQELTARWIDEIYVLAENIVEVPTGMLGPETPEECRVAQSLFPRVPISKRMRFLILRRDNYQCQICGKRGSDGVLLEIDHKSPSSIGGPTTEENLWVLCADCNKGKSDLPLTLPS